MDYTTPMEDDGSEPWFGCPPDALARYISATPSLLWDLGNDTLERLLGWAQEERHTDLHQLISKELRNREAGLREPSWL